MQTIAHENGTREGKITELRALLGEKFPQPIVRRGGSSVAAGSGFPELRGGVVTEVTGSIGSGALFLDALIASAQSGGLLVALVDGSSSFDVVPMRGQPGRLLWVLCKEASAAIKAADLLLRDGNLPLVVLDLQMNRDLSRIPATTWYRFQRMMELSAATFVVLTPHPLVSSAAERFELRGGWTLREIQQRRTELKPTATRIHRRALAVLERQTA
jgi:hypothetical protein